MHEVECVVGPFVPVDASLEAAVVQAIIVDVDSVVVFHKVDFNHLVAHTPFDVAGEVVPWGVAEIVHPVTSARSVSEWVGGKVHIGVCGVVVTAVVGCLHIGVAFPSAFKA